VASDKPRLRSPRTQDSGSVPTQQHVSPSCSTHSSCVGSAAEALGGLHSILDIRLGSQARDDVVARNEAMAGLGVAVETPPLWHLQTGPERALWGRHKRPWKHGNFIFETGPWANRIGTRSVARYKQWGPSGPQWAVDHAK
jgi:hypothetical protein